MKQDNIIKFFVTRENKCYVEEWLNKLDLITRNRINVRLVRLKYGNYGDYKTLFPNLYELRFSFGKGYRIYFTKQKDNIVLLLNGGDKSKQSSDIAKAKQLVKILTKMG